MFTNFLELRYFPIELQVRRTALLEHKWQGKKTNSRSIQIQKCSVAHDASGANLVKCLNCPVIFAHLCFVFTLIMKEFVSSLFHVLWKYGFKKACVHWRVDVYFALGCLNKGYYLELNHLPGDELNIKGRIKYRGSKLKDCNCFSFFFFILRIVH